VVGNNLTSFASKVWTSGIDDDRARCEPLGATHVGAIQATFDEVVDEFPHGDNIAKDIPRTDAVGKCD
jgi:hypothetical protein